MEEDDVFCEDVVKIFNDEYASCEAFRKYNSFHKELGEDELIRRALNNFKINWKKLKVGDELYAYRVFNDSKLTTVKVKVVNPELKIISWWYDNYKIIDNKYALSLFKTGYITKDRKFKSEIKGIEVLVLLGRKELFEEEYGINILRKNKKRLNIFKKC